MRIAIRFQLVVTEFYVLHNCQKKKLLPTLHYELKQVNGFFFSVMKRTEREADLSPASGEEFKNAGTVRPLFCMSLLRHA